MNGTPETISIQIVDSLNELAKSETISPFDLARLEQAARKLRQADPGHGDMVLGIVYCLKGDIANMHKAHRNSLRLMRNAYISLINYSQSLRRVDLFGQSLAYAMEAFDLDPNDQLLIGHIRNALLSMGMNNLAKRFHEQLITADANKDINYTAMQAATANKVRPMVDNLISKHIGKHEELWTRLANR